VKTTVEISDALYEQVRELAHREGRTFRSVLEEALLGVVHDRATRTPYEYRDCTVGVGWLSDEWSQRPLRELIHDTYPV
jgi:hypothetical protein